MLSRQLIQKAESIRYNLEARSFKQSRAWADNPHNRQIPDFDPSRLERELEGECRRRAVPYTDLVVSHEEYRLFRTRFKLPAMSLYALKCREKKLVEHLIAFRLLDLKAGDRYVDIASESSPFPGIFRCVMGIDAYSQDLAYPAGLNGTRIGSSADRLPVPDRWIDGTSLQCAFEHFQGDIDRHFIHELARVLRPGARCVIVPLYMHVEALNIYDPLLYTDWSDRCADPDATVVAEIGLGGRFERIYSPDTLKRILIPDIGLGYTVFAVRGLDSIVQAERLGPQSTELLRRIRFVLMIERLP